MRRVLVTRPEPGASRTADRLAAAGFDPVILPLTETRILPVSPTAFGVKADAVAVTSASAIRHSPTELIGSLAHLPCFAVGGRTAKEARDAGFSDVFEGPGEAAGLAGRIKGEGTIKRIAYLCGRVRRPDFERALSSAGVAVVAVETYDTIEKCVVPEAPHPAFENGPLDAVLLFSAVAAKALNALIRPHRCPPGLESAEFFCLSARIAESLEHVPPEKIHVAAEPTEDELLSLMKGRC